MESKTALVYANLFFLFMTFIAVVETSQLSPYLVRSFPSAPNATLNHFTVSDNGNVYIGAVDNLYHLSQQFDVLSKFEFQNGGERNVNKILAIVPFPVNNLISCGTGLNEACQLRNLDDISQDVKYLFPETLTVAPQNDSTVGLVVKEASGRVSLYVAQTVRSEDRDIRRPISSICLHKEDQNGCTEADNRETNVIGAGVKSDFIIQYVTVFSYDNYTYYVASQRKDATKDAVNENPIVPKISRVCHNNEMENLDGFTEITLECRGDNGTLYSVAKSAAEVNGTLYIAFVKNIPENGRNFNEGNQSALCMYDMGSLITVFEDSLVNCSCDAGYRSHSNYLSGGSCPSTELDCEFVKVYTCFPHPSTASLYPERSPLLGGLPGLPVYEFSGAPFSSVMLTEIHHPVLKMVAFIGTTGGTLLKVHFDEGPTPNAVLFETVEVGYSVLSDTWISPRGDTAMFLTEKQLLEIKIANCSQYETCAECIKPGQLEGDPYCGWCTLEKRCTRYEDCNSSNIPSRWLWYNEAYCSAITDVTPDSLSIDENSQMVNLSVSHLPMPGNFSYVCHFGPSFISPATFDNGSLSCASPEMTDISIPDGDDAVEVVFAISSTEFNISFVTTTYTFFDCSRIRGCTECVSKWACDWCIDELLCTHNRSRMCNNITSRISNASDYCPQLVPGESVVPSGVYRELHVTARNLNLTQSVGLLEREYECVIEDKETKQLKFITDATFMEGANGEYNVTCSNATYSYPMTKQEFAMSLSLRWRNTNVSLDEVYNVTLYKCHVDRPDCSRCLSNITTPPEFECGWCPVSQGFCAVMETCSSLLRQCSDKPTIVSISPTSSPIEGGTIVEINGTDLGQRFSDIVNVSLAEVVCDHRNYSDNYIVGARLTCKSGNSSTARHGKVSLLLRNGMEAEYDQFSYNDPQINSFYPLDGPQSGGTLITISGTDLQTGRDVRVEVGEEDCGIKEHSAKTIVCKNNGLSGNGTLGENQTVSVYFDGHGRLAPQPFVYHKDPTVTQVTPQKTIISGGNILTVTGDGFLPQSPKIRFTVGDKSTEEECSSPNRNEMTIICRSPSLEALLEQRKRRAEATAEGTVDVGFIMDGVTELLNWSRNNFVEFQYFKDPEYETFSVRDHQTTSNNLLTLNGAYLNWASSIEDVIVYVGTELCEINSLRATALICTLPPDQPEPGDVYGNRRSNGLPFIIVRHANLEFNIGYIDYIEPSNIVLYIICALGALAVVVVVISFIIVCCIRRKKTEKIRDLELKVINIHESVSDNLRTLFATLQTTLHDFDTAIGEQINIPLLEKRRYLLNMMFLGLNVKPSPPLPEGCNENLNISAAMKEFAHILHHKSFLKVLIATLDKITSISAMDRANAGSLLSICLLLNGKLELYTDLLLNLMEEHIQDCDNKKKQRTLFRGNDTMLEKLISNWFTIFLYAFLKDHAALQVFQLFEAIKYVCEMGPIDAVSGKSQFSINDQEMLEAQIDFEEVELEVITNSETGERKPLKVIDVNTITQVKERIISCNYRHLPYSQRPSPFMLDLMWKASLSGQLMLRDDENLPGTLEKACKKICTLKDTGVSSGAVFHLVPKQENPNAEADLNGRQAGNQGNPGNIGDPDYHNIAQPQRTFDVNVREGIKVWHLIKEDQDCLGKNDKKQPRTHEEIKEVVLPFLPATRNYIQKYVDNVIDVIFAANDGAEVPVSIKYLFQFFDQEAEKQGKPEVAKAWKTNVLPLRYWSTIIANPQYVLDVGVFTYTHASLRIIVQVIKDVCVGNVKPVQTQDFSPSRLLYSSFLQGYISKLDNYYLFIRNLGRVNSEDLRDECAKVEQEFKDTFDLNSTMQKLFGFVVDHQKELNDALAEDGVCSELSLATKLQNVVDLMRYNAE